mgnify:CR=1 FL=1
MANSATPITAEFAGSVKFGNKVTKTTIGNKATQAKKAGNTQFDHSLTLGSMMVQVDAWWNDGGKEEVLEAGFDADIKAQVKPLTGLSYPQYSKLRKAFVHSESHPELLAEYRAAEDAKERACNIERWNKYVKEGKLDEAEAKKEKPKYKGQFQVSGFTPAVRITLDGLIETEADEDAVIIGLAILKRSLIASGMERAAEAIILPEELANGETAEEVADRFFEVD